jgi:DNA-binding MarR family transcriptional regulator
VKIEEAIKVKNFSSERQKAYINVLYTATFLKGKINARLKKFDLTHEQFNVLRIIKGQYPNPVCVKDITDRMIEPNSNTTRILDRLEQKQLVKRNPSERDRRELWITITENGLNLLVTIEADFLSDNPHGRSLSHAEASLLNNLLDKLRAE